MPACRILCSLCVVSTRIFAHRDFAFYRNKVVSRIRAAKLVVDNKVRRVHIWVICCLKAPLPLAFIQFELPVLHKVRALNRHFPRAKLACVLVFPINTRSHRRIQLPVYKLHCFIGLDGFLPIKVIQSVFIGHAKRVSGIVIFNVVALPSRRIDPIDIPLILEYTIFRKSTTI